MCFPTSANLSSCHALWTLESISLSRCHVSIPSHRHLMQISDTVSVTDWHLSSPLPRCCHVHQARPLDQLSRGAQLSTGLGCSHTSHNTGEREGTQSGLVSSNFRAFSYEQISITTVSTWVHSTCWDWSSMIQYDHLMIRISQLVERYSIIKPNRSWFVHSPDLGVLSQGYDAHNNSG